MPDFRNPAAFLILIAIPLFYILRHFNFFTRLSLFINLSDWNGSSFDWNSKISRVAAVISNILGISSFLCAVIALANPVFYKYERIYTSRGADIVFVLDISPSMAAKDFNGSSRFDAAKQAIKKLINSNTGTAFGLVAMANNSSLSVPPTSDSKMFLNQLDSLKVGLMGDGTALGIGISTAVFHLSDSSAPKKTIILVTDGENNAGAIHPETAASLASENNIIIYTLGVGSSGSVPIDYQDPITGKNYYGFLNSTIDSSSLKQIARIGGGRYFDVQSIDDLILALTLINKNESIPQTYHSRTTGIYLYDKLVLAAAVLMAVVWVIKRLFLGEMC